MNRNTLDTLYTNKRDLNPTQNDSVQSLTGRIAKLNDYITTTRADLNSAIQLRDALIRKREEFKNEPN